MSQEQTNQQLQPNKSVIQKHIEFLMSGMENYIDGKIEIAYGDENNTPRHAKKFTLDEPWSVANIVEFAASKNAEGRNIYIVGSYLNPDSIDNTRCEDKDYYATNSVWMDFDNDGDVEVTQAELRMRYAMCRPTAAVVTGKSPRLRCWLWWKLDEAITNPDTLVNVLRGIAQHVGGDKAVCNPARLTRLAGCISWPTDKKASQGRSPYVVEFGLTNEHPVSIEKLEAAFPNTSPKPRKATGGLNFENTHERWTDTQVSEMLSFLPQYDGKRMEWLPIGMALNDGGYDFELFRAWSAKSQTKYSYDDCVNAWNSLEPGKGITMGTLVSMAKAAGWLQVNNDYHEPNKTTKTQKESITKDTIPQFSGLIKDTIDDILATSQKPQPELATLNVLAAMGAIFGRRYASPMDTRTNLYTVGIAPTGSGKDHSRKYVKSLMLKAELKTYLGSDSLVSGAGLITAVSQKPSQILHLDEFGMLLAEIKNKNTASHLKICSKILTEFYSASNTTYYGGQYADKKIEQTTIRNPNLCIYGTTTMDKYIEAMDRSVITSGELNRYIILRPSVEFPARIKLSGRSGPKQNIIDSWSALVPAFGTNNTNVEEEPIIVHWDWLEDRIWNIQLYQDGMVESDPICGPLWARYAENVIKIAMICSISRNGITPVMENEDLDVAEHIIKASVLYMSKVANENMYNSLFEKDCNRVLDAIKSLGGGCKKRDISNRTRDMDSGYRGRILDALLERGAIIMEVEKNTSGVQIQKFTFC